MNNTQAHNTANWNAHYESRIGESYPLYCRKQYKPFLNAIRAIMFNQISEGLPRKLVVREEGCGIATITKILAQDAFDSVEFRAFDYDTAQVNNSIKNLEDLENVKSVYQGDHFEDQGFADIIHAHGVLEHFSDEEIAKVLERQKREARVVIHYVPLEGWGKVGSYGDERLLSLDHWVETHKPARAFTFNDGKDAVLIWS